MRSIVTVLVDFYADWCGPCQIQVRILKDFAAEFDGVKIVKVDVEKNSGLAAEYDVKGLPTMLIFRDGKVTARHVGVANKEQLKAAFSG